MAAIGIPELPVTEVTPEALLGFNEPAVRAVGVPGGGGISTAADLALFYQALLHDPAGIWDAAVLADAKTNVRNTFPDFLGTPANRTLGLVLAGDDGRSNLRGMGQTVSAGDVRAQRRRRPDRLGRPRDRPLVRLPHQRHGPARAAAGPPQHRHRQPRGRTALAVGLAWQHQERGRTVARRVQTRGDLVKVDVRKLGIWMVALGGVAMSVGIVADAVRQADDPTLAAREGIFDLSGFPHALFFGGLCAAGLGLFALLFGSALYRPGGHVTVGRRLAQVGAPIAAVVLIAGCATVASNSSLSEPNAAAAAEAAAGHTHTDATATESADGRHAYRLDRHRGNGHRRDRHRRCRALARHGDRGYRERRHALRDRFADAGIAGPGRHG